MQLPSLEELPPRAACGVAVDPTTFYWSATSMARQYFGDNWAEQVYEVYMSLAPNRHGTPTLEAAPKRAKRLHVIDR
eukprot:COSAG01_NODE_25670_length_737_cov_1.564263_1_plen_77_part_00